ncbi:MAG: HEPN domain-containing protein [Thermoplasmatota archaeon]
MDKVEIFMETAYERLESAEILLKNGFYKDSVNRSYFAMVSAAQAALTIRKIEAKTHRGLHSQFHNEFLRTHILERDFGRMFDVTEEMRIKFDYNPEPEASEELAEDSLHQAEKFVEEIRRHIEKVRS